MAVGARSFEQVMVSTRVVAIAALRLASPAQAPSQISRATCAASQGAIEYLPVSTEK